MLQKQTVVRPEIVYFGKQLSFLTTASRTNEEIVFLSSLADVKSKFNDPKVAVLLAVCDQENFIENLEALEKSEQESQKTSRILVVEGLQMQQFAQAINRSHVHFCISPEDFTKRWKEILDLAVALHTQANSKAQLLKESTRQFRELESLNENLENLVQERTKHIELSKIEEEEKLNKVRSLIRFIKDLAQMPDFEELLQLLRKELRKFHKISDPTLVYQVAPDKVDFVSLQSGQIIYSNKKGVFPFKDRVSHSAPEVSKAMANYFGRPFIKLFYVPIDISFVRRNSYSLSQAALVWEHSLTDVEISAFTSFIKERIQSIAITIDRLLLENELVQFSYRWEKTFDGFRDPIAIVDLDFEVLRANRKFSEKLVRKKCFESFAKKEKSCDGCPVIKAIETGESQKGQIQVGSKVFEVHSYPILLENSNRVTNVVNQYVDITQSRELYLRMLQGEKMGAIGLLAGHIAHELNNPLTGIRSLSQVLIQTTPSAELKADLQEIEKAAGRSQQIIRNLLDFSAEGAQEKRKTTWEEIVSKTTPMLKAVMRHHRQEMVLDSEAAYIEVEPNLMQQVYFNLINNACQAMKGVGVLRVSSFAVENEVVLRVSDTGLGVSEDIREKIFEPFFTTKKEGLGTGLGLSLSKKIVESFKGKISILESSEKGTVFEVRLPRVM